MSTGRPSTSGGPRHEALSGYLERGGENYVWDLAAVHEFHYQLGLTEDADKAKAKPGAALSPETEARALEMADLELRTLRATTAIQEDKQATGRVDRLKSEKAVSLNEEVLAIFMYHAAAMKAGLDTLGNDLLQLLLDCGVHPDEAKRKLDEALARLVDALDEADPLKEPVEGTYDETPEPRVDEPRSPAGEPDQPAAQDGPQDQGVARADAPGGQPAPGAGTEGS
jgi:hypothetical protein